MVLIQKLELFEIIKKIYSIIRRLILSFTLILAKKLKITNFKHLTTDGTIKLACNSPFNIIKKKDIHLCNI